MKKKQTAVEWFWERYLQYSKKVCDKNGNPKISEDEIYKGLLSLIEQAKRKENEQMFYSFEVGYDKGHNSSDWVNNVPKMRSLYEDCKKKGHII